MAIRDRLADEMDDPDISGSQLASVAKQLVDVLNRIESIAEPEGSAVDDLAARRAERLGSSTPDAPGDGEQRRPRSRGARGQRGTAT